jgi:hypothetical protein
MAGACRRAFGTARSDCALSNMRLGVTDWQTQRIAAAASANLGMLTFERYWDRYRGAYTFFSGRTIRAASRPGTVCNCTTSIAERSSVGLAYTPGGLSTPRWASAIP